MQSSTILAKKAAGYTLAAFNAAKRENAKPVKVVKPKPVKAVKPKPAKVVKPKPVKVVKPKLVKAVVKLKKSKG